MATVTGFTAERMLEIEATTVVSGEVVGDNLILTQRDGTPIDAGPVVGSDGVVRIPHGTDPNVARPADAPVVYWIGTATPVNALPSDWRTDS